jgi:peptidoglycan/LPS O-acetylase OafA/YrhL
LGGKDRAYHLDGLRGVVAIMVVLYHLRPQAPWLPGASGYLAVDFFFLLSGYVLAMAYGERISRGMGFIGFLLVRAVRLYPMYLAGLCLGLLRAVAMHRIGDPAALSVPEIASQLGANLLILPGPPVNGDPQLFPLNGPSWSLFWEALVNLLFFFILLRLPTRLLATVAVAAAVLFFVQIAGAGTANIGWNWPDIDAGLPRALTSFVAGMVAYRFFPNPSRLATPFALVAAPVLLVLLAVSPGAFRVPFDIAVIAVAFPSVLLFALHLELPEILQGTGKYLGALSYPLYVLHYPLIGAFSLVTTKLGLAGVTRTVVMIIAILGTTAVATHFELGVRRFIRQRLGLPRRTGESTS